MMTSGILSLSNLSKLESFTLLSAKQYLRKKKYNTCIPNSLIEQSRCVRFDAYAMTESPGFRRWPRCVRVWIVSSLIPSSEAFTSHTSAKTCCKIGNKRHCEKGHCDHFIQNYYLIDTLVEIAPCPGNVFLSLARMTSISITMYSVSCLGSQIVLKG